MKKITLSKLIELNEYLKSFVYKNNEKIYYSGELSLKKISDFLNIDLKELNIKFNKINSSNINYDGILKEEKMQELFLELGYDFEKNDKLEFYEKLQYYFTKNDKLNFEKRSLIVTVMGHVDHGKTTLLDTIRKSNLTKKEVGSITQKISAYKINYKNQNIIFIDTPGHEFFDSMRRRGTEITDLIILVVSGVEGLKPQTIESIELAKKMGIHVIVFVNKSDLLGYDFENIKSQLSKYDLISEEWGGKTVFIQGSAKEKKGIDNLLSVVVEKGKEINTTIQTSKFTKAIILDSYLEKSGPMISVIIKDGKLKLKDFIIVSGTYGRIKILKDDNGNNIKETKVGDCVLIGGLSTLPLVGSTLYNFETDQILKTLSEFTINENNKKRKQILKSSFEDFFAKETKEKIDIILKIDTKGSEEAILKIIDKLLKKEWKNKLNFIIIGVGDLTINDVKLASKTKAFILTFNIKIKLFLIKELKEKSVNFFEFQLIYELIDKLEDFLDSRHVEQKIINVTGKMKVTNIFVHSKFGRIAGGIVEEGFISKNDKFLRVIRDNEIIIEKQKILTIHHEKDEINKAITNQTCGILFKKFFDFQVDDFIEQYEVIIKKNDKKI